MPSIWNRNYYFRTERNGNSAAIAISSSEAGSVVVTHSRSMQPNTERLVLPEGRKLSLVCGYSLQDAGGVDKGWVTDVPRGACHDALTGSCNKI